MPCYGPSIAPYVDSQAYCSRPNQHKTNVLARKYLKMFLNIPDPLEGAHLKPPPPIGAPWTSRSSGAVKDLTRSPASFGHLPSCGRTGESRFLPSVRMTARWSE